MSQCEGLLGTWMPGQVERLVEKERCKECRVSEGAGKIKNWNRLTLISASCSEKY